MPKLTFVESSHSYYLDGVWIPGVSTIISRYSPQYANGEYRELGTAVHLSTLLYDRGELESVGAAIAPRLNAYRQFRAEIPMRVTHREGQLYHPTYLYAGTPDIGAMDTPYGEYTVFDLKASDSRPSKHYGLQMAAYAGMCFHGVCDPCKVARVVINLKSNGTWEPFLYDRGDDWHAFLAAFELYKWERS